MSECSICRGDEPEIAGTALSKVFFARERKLDGHLVVATRAHRTWLEDLSSAEAADLFVTAHKVAASLTGKQQITKFYLAAVGDVDRHFHLHLLPRAPEQKGLGPFIFGEDGWIGGATRGDAGAVIEQAVREALERE